MAIIKQAPKERIDTGTIGNASTGDILYDGGNKINSDLDSLYNTFGDQRLFAAANGVKQQLLHATGYYQKVDSSADMSPSVKMGSMIDISTKTGSITCTLERGKPGECIVFVNSDGSLSQTDFFEILAIDSFVSVPTGKLKVTAPFSRVTLWCISNENNVSLWDYSIESMFGDKLIPLDETFNLTTVAREIPLIHSAELTTIKLLLTGRSVTNEDKFKISEVLLYVDRKNSRIISTEYGVLKGGNITEEDELYSIAYSIDATGMVTGTASSDTANFRLAIKVVETQTFGVSQ